MPYSYSLCDSIDETNLGNWNQLRYAEGDPFMDPRFVATVERSMGDAGKYWTVIVYDTERRPAAIACLSLISVDGAILAGKVVKRLINGVRRIFPRYLRFNVLFVGLPVSVGQSHLRIRPDADTVEVLLALNKVLGELLARHRASFVVWKEFDAEEAERLQGLRQHGYLQADSLPMSQFETRFRDFDDYCAALRSQYRRSIRQSLRKFETSGLRTVRLTGNEGAGQLYSDDVHRLYEAVLGRAKAQLEKLPAEFFRELCRQFGDRVGISYTYRDRRVVAFVCSLWTGSQYHLMVMGLDYDANLDADVYFNSVLQGIEHGLQQNVSELFVGQNSDTFKRRLGCFQRPRYFFIKGRGILRPVLSIFSGMFFPAVELLPQQNVLRKAPEPAAEHAGTAQPPRKGREE